MNVKDMLSKLTDVFKKSTGSNNEKLFTLVQTELESLSDTASKVEIWRDIDKAKGKSLNYLGENVGQNRGRATDEVYRVLIRGKVARNASDGSINRMIDAIASSLQCPSSDIQIINANDSESPDEHEPATIIIKHIPLDALNNTGLSTNQFLQIVDSVRSGGVRVAYVNLEGTFSFSSTAEIENSELGFADVDMTTGGTLGGLFTPGNDYKLPI